MASRLGNPRRTQRGEAVGGRTPNRISSKKAAWATANGTSFPSSAAPLPQSSAADVDRQRSLTRWLRGYGNPVEPTWLTSLQAWRRRSTTCQKAERYLDAHRTNFDRVHNLPQSIASETRTTQYFGVLLTIAELRQLKLHPRLRCGPRATAKLATRATRSGAFRPPQWSQR